MMNWQAVRDEAERLGAAVWLGPYPRGAGEAYALQVWGAQASQYGLALAKGPTGLWAVLPPVHPYHLAADGAKGT